MSSATAMTINLRCSAGPAVGKRARRSAAPRDRDQQIGIGPAPWSPSDGRDPGIRPAWPSVRVRRSAGRRAGRAASWRARVGLLEPAVELELVVALVGEAAAAFEVGVQVALQALDDALGLRVRRSRNRHPTFSCPQSAASSAVGRPPWPWMPACRSQTNVSGSPPSDHRQRAMPESRSGVPWRRSAPRRPRASSPDTRRPPSPGAARDARPRPAPTAPTDRTGRPRPADRRCAETSAVVARRTAAPRAGSRRGSSSSPRSRAARSAPGSAGPGA